MVITAYHGTDSKECSFTNISNRLFLTDNIHLASTFGHNVYRMDVRAGRVFEVDWMGYSWGGGFFPDSEKLFNDYVEYAAGTDEDEQEYVRENGMCIDMLAAYLFDGGYDMLIAYNVLEEKGFSEVEYVASEKCSVTACSAMPRYAGPVPGGEPGREEQEYGIRTDTDAYDSQLGNTGEESDADMDEDEDAGTDVTVDTDAGANTGNGISGRYDNYLVHVSPYAHQYGEIPVPKEISKKGDAAVEEYIRDNFINIVFSKPDFDYRGIDIDFEKEE